MNDINKFQELLSKTLEIAKKQNNRIEGQTIKDIFATMELNDTQYEQISRYLVANKIEVIGYVNAEELHLEEQPSTNAKAYIPKEINKRDSVYIKDYLEELNGIREASVEEEKNLVEQIKQGDPAAKQRFIEVNLRRVVEIAGEFKNQGMTAEDLIQEGNMALLQSVNGLPATDDMERIREYVQECIRKYIAESIAEQQENDNFEHNVMQKINQIYDSLKALEEQLGRKANISELAEYMKVTEEEIQNVLDMSADIVDLGEVEHHHHHDPDCNCHEGHAHDA